jgi:hypothetical protein
MGSSSVKTKAPSRRPRTAGGVVGGGLRLSDRGLSAIRAAAAPVGDFPLLAVFVHVAD